MKRNKKLNFEEDKMPTKDEIKMLQEKIVHEMCYKN